MRQLTFSATGFERYGKTTRRAAFLAEMEQVVPSADMCALIEPFYPKPGNGRPSYGLERMLRIYFLQQWFNLSDPGVEDALYDSATMRDFARIDLGREPAPDETTICRFRHSARSPRPRPPPVRGGPPASRSEWAQGLDRHDRRRFDHPCAVLDEERGHGARSRDAPDAQGQPMVLWYEGAYRRR